MSTLPTGAKPKAHMTGMLGFTVVWIGQVFSLLGTSMTGFALTIWAWQITGQATALALVGFSAFAPIVLMSPIAGAIVDRHDRKKIMMMADFAAGVPTIAVLLLYTSGNLQIWHLYITGAIAGAFQAFHFPAYSAAVSMMLPKQQYGRASGMLAAAQFISTIFAPIVAALLLILIGIGGILVIDIMSFTGAVLLLPLVHIPQPPITEAGRKGVGSIWKESLYGFKYIFERRSLLGLQLTFFLMNLMGTFNNTLLAPMILARTGDNELALASVLSAGGVGGLVGSVVLTTWGGPKRRVHGILTGNILASLSSGLLLGLGRDIPIWASALFISLFLLPMINGSSQAIWQAKVAPDVQGRVFATRLLIAQLSVPIAMLLAGPLADRVFEPAMMSNGNLTIMFSGLVGTGPGAGMAVLFIITGVLGAMVSFVGYAIHAIRNAEDILPDHDAKAPDERSKRAEEG